MNLKEKIVESRQSIGKIFLSVEEKDNSYQVYEVLVEELKLNPFNGRFRASAHDDENTNIDIENEAYNLTEEKKERFIKEQNESKYKIMKANIDKEGQLEPIVLNQDGLAIDGNLRLTILRDLNIMRAKVIFLNKTYTSAKEIERMETLIQFKKAEKVQYTPLNREIKIANIFEGEIERGQSKAEARDFTTQATGAVASEIDFYVEKYKMLRESFKRNNLQLKYKWFEKTSDQFKSMMNLVKNVFNRNINIKHWFDDEKEEIKNLFIDYSILFILTKPKAVGGTRLLFSNKETANLITSEKLFYQYVNGIKEKFPTNKIIEIVKNDITIDLKALSKKANTFMNELIEELKNKNSSDEEQKLVRARVKQNIVTSILRKDTNFESGQKVDLEKDNASKYATTAILFIEKMKKEEKTEASKSKAKFILDLLSNYLD